MKVERAKTSATRVFIRVLLLGTTLSWQAACQSTPPAEQLAPTGTSPDWAHRLRENVAPVPVERERLEARPLNGAASRSSVDWPRGTSRSLTRPIEPTRSTPAPPAPSSRAGGVPAGAASGGARDGGPVVVNINNTPERGEISPSAGVGSGPDSTLERLYGGNFGREPDRELDQFGYGYFQQSVPTPDAGPVPDHYLLGPGDEIMVTVWGGYSASLRLQVNRDGSIEIPEMGTVPVAGRPFRELKELVRGAIAATRRDFDLSVSMGQLRRIQVHVVGHVTRPGLVEIPANSDVLTALIAAGGPAKTGSLREVQVEQTGVRSQIDLYSFLVDGTPPAIAPLESGAVVSVPAIGPTVGVAGYVLRPGIYEIREDATIDEAIRLAGGLTAFTFTPRVQVERTVEGRGRQTIDVELNDAGRRQPLGDGELLLVGAVDDTLQPVVTVAGEVVRPGTFQYRAGLRLADLIRQADGLKVDAYLPQALISRQVGESGVLSMVPDRVAVESSRRVIVVDLGKAMAGDPSENVELMPLDHIEIRSVAESTVRPTVTVIGAVQAPGTYELTAGLTVSSLVAMAGNVLPEVYYDEAELIRRVYDPSTQQLDVRRFRFDLGRALRDGGAEDPYLESGDQLVIRSLRSAQVTVNIEGEVRFPGTYVFPAGAHITDLIAAAGGLSRSADLRAAGFFRRSAREMERSRFRNLVEQVRRSYEGAMENMVQNGRSKEGLAAKLALVQTEELMQRMERSDVNGRIVIPFRRHDFPESPHNLTLEDGDRLIIPRQRETVSVMGLVFNPTSFVAEQGMTVGSIIDRAGGLAEYGDKKRIYVIRADGTVESLAQREGRRLSLKTALLPGDVVLVPRRPLERSVGAQLSDVLALARQAAEVALISSSVGQFGESSDLTNVVTSPIYVEPLGDYDSALLERPTR